MIKALPTYQKGTEVNLQGKPCQDTSTKPTITAAKRAEIAAIATSVTINNNNNYGQIHDDDLS